MKNKQKILIVGLVTVCAGLAFQNCAPAGPPSLSQTSNSSTGTGYIPGGSSEVSNPAPAPAPAPAPGVVVSPSSTTPTSVNSSLLWENSGGGVISFWNMSDATVLNKGTFPDYTSAGFPAWRLVTAFDLNGDSQSDLLWQNTTTSEVVYWLMNGNRRVGSGTIPGAEAYALNGWTLVGTVDLNNDGKGDLIWQNTALETLAYWEMNGVIRVTHRIWRLPPGHRLVGAMESNGDGRPDLIMQNIFNGEVTYHVLDGNLNIASFGTVPECAAGALPGWRLMATADVNKDGKIDFIWQNHTINLVAYWMFNGLTRVGGAYLPPPEPGFSVVTFVK